MNSDIMLSTGMLNFTVGPVQTPDFIRELGKEQVPYFRTPEFSEIMKQNEEMLCRFASAPDGARAVFLTGSGTCAMEAVTINVLSRERDRVLVINGGTFGARFSLLCDIHHIRHDDIGLRMGEGLKPEQLWAYAGRGYTALLVNLHETSTGVLYDLSLLHSFCEKEHMILIVDAISAFLADEIDMKTSGIDALIVGSQKALALAPGLSAVVLSERAIARVMSGEPECLYQNLKTALADGTRGQTPFTPAVMLLLQLHERLAMIDRIGADAERARIAALAKDFRTKLRSAGLPFTMFSESPSNAVTPLYCEKKNAYQIFSILKDRYHIWVCPNGGEMHDTVFRVGHLGDLTAADNDRLIAALTDIEQNHFAD